jgi:hypothetical protein
MTPVFSILADLSVEAWQLFFLVGLRTFYPSGTPVLVQPGE